MRKRFLLTLALLVLVAWSINGSTAQGANASLGGTVQDSTKALIAGVTVTLTNTQTGVVDSRLTNDSGAYAFPSVPPGTYKITGDLTGFRSATENNVQLGTAAQVRIDLVLQVGGGTGEVVQVNANSTETRINETSSSVGEVLSGERSRNLPLVGGNVLDLLTVLPGFRESNGGPTNDTVGGLSLDTVNATINGVPSNATRVAAGVSNGSGYQSFTPTVINPDLVGEIRLILAPVDAELGRGNSQVQIQTRSGTNKYTGSVVWNIQNSAMDANTWSNNHTATVVNGITTSNKTTPDWQNRNQITGSFGGPIIKNKTFFFFLYDYQNVNSRTQVTNTVYTDAAKAGIWKYYPGWNSLNAAPNSANSACVNTAPTGNVFTGNQVTVDILGNPLPSLPNPVCGGPPVTLQCYSVFGNQKFDWRNNAMVPVDPAVDCPGGNFRPGPGNALQTWDLLRPGSDATGYLSRILKLMPEANNWSTSGSGDGLNTAGNRYLRGRKGSNTTNSQFGVAYSAADQNNRKQINLKIDHSFNSKNRVSAQWSYQWNDSIGANVAAWEVGYQGAQVRRPQTLTLNGTSTISPSLLNEARFGVNLTRTANSPAWANLNNPEGSATAQSFLFQGGSNPVNGKAYPIIFNPGATAGGFMDFSPTDLSNSNPLWDYADTIRWTHQRHSFSFGGEYRRPITSGFNASGYETSAPGNPSAASFPQLLADTAQYKTELPMLNSTTRVASVTLLNLLSGSVGSASTSYWIDGYPSLSSGTWADTTTENDVVPTADKVYGHQSRRQVSNEWSFFAKDDYKISRHVTLNLGLRYDLNMSPYLAGGLTNRLADDGLGLFGPARPTSGDLLANFMVPGDSATGLFFSNYGNTPGGPVCATGAANPNGIPVSNCDPNYQSQIIFVGPGSNNPDQTLVPQKGRFSPAVGFAWQLPFFGEGKTTVRGGFQRTYGGAGAQFSGGLTNGLGAGDTFTSTLSVTDPAVNAILTTGGPLGTGRALNLSDLPILIPKSPTRAPADPLPLIATNGNVSVTYSAYDPNYVTPYTDNLTLSVTRNIARNYTLDVRFVDTLGKKQSGSAGAAGSAGSIDLNQFNVFHNPELLQAFINTRGGKNDPLFDQMLYGLNLNNTVTGYGSIGTTVNSNMTVNGVTTNNVPVLQRGSAHLRRAFASQLANGDFNGILTTMMGAITVYPGLQPLPSLPGGATGIRGRVLRNGCDRLANGLTQTFNAPDVNGNSVTIAPRCFAENYVITNQALAQAQLAENFGHSNYQSGQLQFTARPVQGVSIQGTYSLSKTMTLPGSGYTDPLNRHLDYGPSLNSIGQEFRSNASIELPMGPNKLLFGNSSGWFARAIEKWQTNFILTLPQGVLRTMNTNNMLYANGRPNIIGPWKNPNGEVNWNGTTNGQYFGSVASPTYALFTDPQCADSTVMQQAPTSVATADPTGFSIASQCTLRGLGKVVPAGTEGSVTNALGTNVIPLLATPLPGNQGNLGVYTMHTIPRWKLDASASKQFRLTESKSVQIRIDTTNILNHPIPGDPTGLNNGNSFTPGSVFGQLTSKTGSRTFQAQLRFSF